MFSFGGLLKIANRLPSATSRLFSKLDFFIFNVWLSFIFRRFRRKKRLPRNMVTASRVEGLRQRKRIHLEIIKQFSSWRFCIKIIVVEGGIFFNEDARLARNRFTTDSSAVWVDTRMASRSSNNRIKFPLARKTHGSNELIKAFSMPSLSVCGGKWKIFSFYRKRFGSRSSGREKKEPFT